MAPAQGVLRPGAWRRDPGGAQAGGGSRRARARRGTTPLAQAIRADFDATKAAAEAGSAATDEFIRGKVLFNATKDAESRGRDPLTQFEHPGIERASQPFKDMLSPVEQLLHEMGPTYTIKPAPKLAWLYDPAASGPVISALRDREALGTWLMHDGPFAGPAKFMDWLTAPTDGHAMSVAARQALYAELVPLGAKPAQIDEWVSNLTKMAEVQKVGHYDVPIHRGPGPTRTAINDAAGKIWTPGSKVEAAIGDNFENVLDRSSNRFIRSIEADARVGEAGALGRAVIDTAYRGVQALRSAGRARRVPRPITPSFGSCSTRAGGR